MRKKIAYSCEHVRARRRGPRWSGWLIVALGLAVLVMLALEVFDV